MTGNDGALTLPLLSRPEPLDGPAPDVLVAFDDEFFVEWQVADIPRAPESAFPQENQILFR